MKKETKIAVFHDAFLYRGGGERLVTLLAKSLNADIISGFFSNGSFIPEELGFCGKKISLGKPIFMKGIRHLILKKRFKNTKKILQNYDVIILSGNCLDVINNIPKTTKIIYYCHTPPRYLFDFRGLYLQKIPKIFQKFVNKIFDIQAKKYISFLDRLDLIFTNSKNTHDRLLYFCNKESIILYPPIDTQKFVPKNIGDSENIFVGELKKKIFEKTGKSEYFLSFSRLSPPKRVDMVVDAFLEMKEKNLVFTYGKNDPMYSKIIEKCKNANNIFPILAPSDNDFISLVQNAVANIYIPIDEDFGMSPVEAMACGIPTIGVDDGGLKETIIDQKTGFLLPKNISVDDIINCIKNINSEKLASMKDDCVVRSGDFSLKKFVENFKYYIKK